MQHRNSTRLRLLEAHSTTVERRTLAGLVRLLESGRLTVQQLSDQELERIVTGLPGEIPDMRSLSAAELEAIVRGKP